MLVFAALLPGARAQGATPIEEPGVSLTPFVGWTSFDRSQRFSSGQAFANTVYSGGRAGFRFRPLLWFEAVGGYTRTSPKVGGDDVVWTHASTNLLFTPPLGQRPVPFVSLGAGWGTHNHRVGPDEDAATLEAALGIRARLSEIFSLRVEARDLFSAPHRNVPSNNVNNLVFGIGVSAGLGGRVQDADADGIPDRLDVCADTPRGCRVDARGCPSDADGDGVCDGLDPCPDTPRGCRVDARGCPADADSDGVCDGLDRCPDTPRGCRVDPRGCPADADNDGVCDGLDPCPNTPRGCRADARGCPADADSDGVCDGLDQCPDTRPGLRVNKDGCPIEIMEKETELLDTGLIRISDIQFESGKTEVPAKARALLDVVGGVLANWPELKIEIGGHSDGRGSAALNLELSRRRAAAVRAYLLEHFPELQSDQLTSLGYGATRPLVPNTSPLNLAKNRRVEFRVLNKQELRREVERRRLLRRGEGAAADTTHR